MSLTLCLRDETPFYLTDIYASPNFLDKNKNENMHFQQSHGILKVNNTLYSLHFKCHVMLHDAVSWETTAVVSQHVMQNKVFIIRFKEMIRKKCLITFESLKCHFLLCRLSPEVVVCVFDFSPGPLLCVLESSVTDCCFVCYVVDMFSSMFNQCFLSLLLENGSGCVCLLSSHCGCNRILVFCIEADDTFI